MRYLIAHMLTGTIRTDHITLSRALAQRFKRTAIANQIDPHLTLKAPFEYESKDEITKLLAAYTQHETAQPVTFSGFHHFNHTVIFMDVQAPKQTYMLIRRLQDQLRSVSWMSFSRFEFPLRLHATLCRAKNPQQGREILALLAKERIQPMDTVLDTISLLEKHEQHWDVVDTFPLTKQHKPYASTKFF